MVSICERLINAVTNEQAQDAYRLEPKGTVVGSGSVVYPDTDMQHHRRRERTYPVRLLQTNTVSPYSSLPG